MQILRARDVDNAVSSMGALQEVLHTSLIEVETKIYVAEKTERRLSREERIELDGMKLARANLLSGIQSVGEVLQWVKVLATKDSEGQELESTRRLPQLHIKELN